MCIGQVFDFFCLSVASATYEKKKRPFTIWPQSNVPFHKDSYFLIKTYAFHLPID